jgi:hypothetical protein
MAPAYGQPVTAQRRRFRGTLGVRFARFAGAAAAALTATEVALTICSGVFHLTATKAALVSWFAGAVTSYALSRWAWNRRGRPDVLRETLPFWVISVVVIAFLTLANKLGYESAAWLHLTGPKHVLWVDLVWLVANCGTFLLRFLIFHYVLFADGATVPSGTGVPRGTHIPDIPPLDDQPSPQPAGASGTRAA